MRQEILGGPQQILAVTGKNPAPLLRFPFGDADARTVALANGAGYVPVRWTVDTLGWEGTAGHISASVVVSRVLAAARPGEIVLMHVGSNPDDHSTVDADALPQVISGLRAQGYSTMMASALGSDLLPAFPGLRDSLRTGRPVCASSSGPSRKSSAAGVAMRYGSQPRAHAWLIRRVTCPAGPAPQTITYRTGVSVVLMVRQEMIPVRRASGRSSGVA